MADHPAINDHRARRVYVALVKWAEQSETEAEEAWSDYQIGRAAHLRGKAEAFRSAAAEIGRAGL